MWTKSKPVEKFVLNKEEHTPEEWGMLCRLFGGNYDSTEVIIVNIDSIEVFDN